jgi:hypothetical protein
VTVRDFGDIGTFIGAIAVVVSLIYLVKEVRHNTRALALTQELAGAQFAIGQFIALATDAQFAGLYRKALVDFRGLGTEEQFRVGQFLMGVFYGFQAAHFGHLVARTANSTTWVGHRAVLGLLLQAPGVQYWWERQRKLFSPAFAAYVDAMLSEAKNSACSVDAV